MFGVSRGTLFLNLEAYSASLCLISFWSKEAQGGWHVLSAFPPVDVDEFSHWLNKLPCFT